MSFRKPRRHNSRRRSPAQSAAVSQLLWTQPHFSDAPIEPLSEEQVCDIHNASMHVLEEIGVLFLNDEALDYFEEADCLIDRETKSVRLGRDFVMEMISHAPSTFSITPRNPEKSINIDNFICFKPKY